jgi:hypothetical protein
MRAFDSLDDTDWIEDFAIDVAGWGYQPPEDPDLNIWDPVQQTASTKIVHIVPDFDVDLDIDSDNDDGFAPPERSPEEDAIEAGEEEIGKELFGNTRDDNANGIPDFGDGYDLPVDIYNQLQLLQIGPSSPNGDECPQLFVPLVIEIPDLVDLTTATITLAYTESDPGDVSLDLDGQLQPGEGDLRIWLKDAPELRRRHAANLVNETERGDFVPSGTYTPAELGITEAQRTAVLYVEAVRAYEQILTESITATLNPGGLLQAEGPKEDTVFVALKPAALNRPIRTAQLLTQRFDVASGANLETEADTIETQLKTLLQAELEALYNGAAEMPEPTFQFDLNTDLTISSDAGGSSGVAYGWIIVGKRVLGQNGEVLALDLSNTLIVAVPYYIIIGDAGTKTDSVTFTKGLTQIEVDGPTGTVEHELWHINGVPDGFYDRAADAGVDISKSNQPIPKPLGYKKQLTISLTSVAQQSKLYKPTVDLANDDIANTEADKAFKKYFLLPKDSAGNNKLNVPTIVLFAGAWHDGMPVKLLGGRFGEPWNASLYKWKPK